eukprot:Lithocolla_globosa_v1_NODE_5653_length_1205_cov_13.143651.p1 type:complete len:321 gc:universal NODE_5653_length_1205_cov_13.143651:82-1044(+)
MRVNGSLPSMLNVYRNSANVLTRTNPLQPSPQNSSHIFQKEGFEDLAILYNKMLKKEEIPEASLLGIISAFKKDFRPEHRATSFRPILLLCMLWKFFEIFIIDETADDLWSYVHDAQGWGQAKRSSTQTSFMVTEIIWHHLFTRLIFVIADVKKAYDLLWRDGLDFLLYQKGFKGKIWRILRKFMKMFRVTLRLSSHEFTEIFSQDGGIGQGRITSVPFWAIFINPLLQGLYNLGIGVNVGNRVIPGFGHADDIILIAYFIKDMQLLLNCCQAYSSLWLAEFSVHEDPERGFLPLNTWEFLFLTTANNLRSFSLSRSQEN